MARTVIHPGEHLAEQLEELRMSAAELARQLKVPANRITGILNGQRAVTGDSALRLERVKSRLGRPTPVRLERDPVIEKSRRTTSRSIAKATT